MTWLHNQQCDYCKAHSEPPITFETKGKPLVAGCFHFRGGKTFKERHARRIARAEERGVDHV